jgi:hypothetical protein
MRISFENRSPQDAVVAYLMDEIKGYQCCPGLAVHGRLLWVNVAQFPVGKETFRGLVY